MRHRVAKNKLGRTSSHRKALFKNLAASLSRHGRIVTTEQKAKALRPFVEKLITLGKKKGLSRYRLAIARLGDEAMAKKLFDEIAPLYDERSGGYTRILKLAEKRLGDAGSNAVIELVGYDVDGKSLTKEPLPEKRSAKERPKEKKKTRKAKSPKKKAADAGKAEAAKQEEPEPEAQSVSEGKPLPEEGTPAGGQDAAEEAAGESDREEEEKK
jgi:large subunit ribosomal protein L17